MNNFANFPWEIIIDWYQKNGRHTLPWREYHHEKEILLYRVWISEIFLQQTQAERVIGYFEKNMKKFPKISHLSQSNYDEFFPYYQGMGYYSRARNLLKTAKIVTETFEKIFPEDKKSLKNLPGIGDYTSSAILAFGYGKPFLAWDTNLEKVFSRYFFGNSKQKLQSEEKEIIQKSFENFIQKSQKNEQKNLVRAINNGLMDFARMMDDKNPANIDWENYPLTQGQFYITRGQLENYEIKKQEIFPIPDAKIIAILHENHKKYFSENPIYEPFVLPASENRDTRNFVKNFFREKYSLEVSVRPVHKKWFSKIGEPFIAVNVQIQTGKHNFYEFEKKFAKKVLDNFYEK